MTTTSNFLPGGKATNVSFVASDTDFCVTIEEFTDYEKIFMFITEGKLDEQNWTLHTTRNSYVERRTENDRDIISVSAEVYGIMDFTINFLADQEGIDYLRKCLAAMLTNYVIVNMHNDIQDLHCNILKAHNLFSG